MTKAGRGMIGDWRAGACLGLVCLLAYANSFQGSFHYDDFHSLVDNGAVRQWRNIPRFFVDPGLFSGDPDKSMYRPLLLTTYALNYAAGEYRVWGYHLVNLGLHLLCSLLVWGIGLRLLGRRREAFLGGLLFALHPLATEPVNYLSSRSESLAACFYLGSFLLYLKGEGQEGKDFQGKAGSPAGRAGSAPVSGVPHGAAAEASPALREPSIRYSSPRSWLPVVGYGLGLLVKEVVITLPALLWLHDWMVRGRIRRWWVYLPYLAVGGGYLLLIRQNGFLTRSLAAPVRDWSAQLWTQAKAPAYYLKLLFLPHGLNVEHQFFPAAGPASGAALAGMALVVSLVLLAWKGRRGLGGFCLAWGAITLLPVLVMPLNVLVNERRLYLALAGLAWLGGCLSHRLRGRWLWGVLPFLGLLTWQRNLVWRDELSLWQDAVRKAPGMYRVQTNLGKARQLAGDETGALQAYQRGLEIDASHGDAFNNIATLYHQQAKKEVDGEARQRLLDQAVQGYQLALERYPDNAKIHQNLGDARSQQGRLAEAAAAYEAALRIDPDEGAVWSNYGQTLYLAERWDQAELAFRRAAELLPGQAEPYNNLGNLYSRRGELERAVGMYQEALARQPEQRAEVLVNLGDTYRQLGELAKAGEVVEEAIRLDPGMALAHYHRGRVARAAGEFQTAAEAFAQAAQLESGQVKARIEWGEVLAEMGEAGKAAAVFGRAVELDPENSRGWYGLGGSLEELGDRQGALQAYGRFLETWTRRDGRFHQVEERVRRLQEGR